jgi:t-SNARE complex subunit (syntaxin)
MIQNTPKYSITDIPRDIAKGEKDKFGIRPFEEGLTQFIEHANTPITIALQGEWGSGKTSLMNTLKNNLCDGENASFFSVWINTWEYSLMKDANMALIEMVSGLECELATIIGNSTGKKIGETILKFSIMAFSAAFNRGTDVVEEILSGKRISSISKLRAELEKNISECIAKTGKQGFIFFVDDLDRIEPSVAVQLLELLKNIFNLQKCIFVLAIDYDVVIKGLEPKFGKLSDQNEREFRSFFDKIIQVPFSMPVTSYMIEDFLKESLSSIRYINEDQLNNKELIATFAKISCWSVGTNPRALKRLLNSLLLIRCINPQKDNEPSTELELLVNFGLVSIQIAFPVIYKLLSLYPGFDKWDEEAVLQMNLLITDEQSHGKQEQMEKWEQTLFKLCENDLYLKKRFSNIIKLLNRLKKEIEEKGETVEDVIGDIISLSSVTNLEAIDQHSIRDEFLVSTFLKELRSELIVHLKKSLPDIAKQIGTLGKRVRSNAFIKFSPKKQMKLHARAVNNGIQLVISVEVPLAKDAGFEEVEQKYDQLVKQFPEFEASNFKDNIVKRDNKQLASLYVSITLPSVEDYFTDKISSISQITAGLYKLMKE